MHAKHVIKALGWCRNTLAAVLANVVSYRLNTSKERIWIGTVQQDAL